MVLGRSDRRVCRKRRLLQSPRPIGNAIYDAIGARVRSLPITPEKILTALGKLPMRETNSSRSMLPPFKILNVASVTDASKRAHRPSATTPKFMPAALNC